MSTRRSSPSFPIWIVTAIAVAVALAPGLSSRPGDGTCADGQVPVPWPLGDWGFESVRLMDSHGQYLQFGADPPYLHEGVDIAACAGDFVYAIESGWVDVREDEGADDKYYICVRDEDDPTQGWKYMHIKNIKVEIGDFVLRDQVLGEVVSFDAGGIGFDHLHLERVAVHPGGTKLDIDAKSVGNPLSRLIAHADREPPRRLPFGAPHPTSAGFLFYEYGTGTLLTPSTLDGKKVEIVARMSDFFSGTLSPSCSSSAIGPCSVPPGPLEIMPRRIDLTIFHRVLETTASAYPRTKVEKVFHNTIDLDAAFDDVEEFAAYAYHGDSVGNYTDRHFLVYLTRCPVDGSGSFKFDHSGEYLLQLVLQDVSGNVDVFERAIDIP